MVCSPFCPMSPVAWFQCPMGRRSQLIRLPWSPMPQYTQNVRQEPTPPHSVLQSRQMDVPQNAPVRQAPTHVQIIATREERNKLFKRMVVCLEKELPSVPESRRIQFADHWQSHKLTSCDEGRYVELLRAAEGTHTPRRSVEADKTLQMEMQADIRVMYSHYA